MLPLKKTESSAGNSHLSQMLSCLSAQDRFCLLNSFAQARSNPAPCYQYSQYHADKAQICLLNPCTLSKLSAVQSLKPLTSLCF